MTTPRHADDARWGRFWRAWDTGSHSAPANPGFERRWARAALVVALLTWALIGIVMIREQITLHADGNSYSGSSTFDAYDLLGNRLQHGTALLIGKRITAVDDPGTTTGIPGLPTSIVNR